MHNVQSILAGVFIVTASITPVAAAEIKDMLGKWQWADYTVEVKECLANPTGARICATVIAGPKNIGMEMVRSKLEKKGDVFYGHIAHPATSRIYMTKMTLKDADTWSLDGCTLSNVCATGSFKRVK